jgi:hypothetical protein
VGPSGINVHNWEVCYRKDWITVLSSCPDTFGQIGYKVHSPRRAAGT